MGACCAPSNKKVADKTPTHIRERQLNSTFKQVKSVKDQSQIAKQRYLYRISQSRILIYNIDFNVAWIEDLSMRSRISFHYQSVKTGFNELFLLQDRLSLLINVDLFTGVRMSDPPMAIYRSSLAYADRKVYVASERILVMDLDKDTWTELPRPSGYALESGCFVVENKLYLVGGVREGMARQEVHVYSLLAQSWLTATVKLPLPMRLPTCVIMDTQVLVCAGFSPLNEPLTEAYIFNFFRFQTTESMSLTFTKSPLMSICYHRTAFLMREDGILACWQDGSWFEIDAEGICKSLLAGETIETAPRDSDELEAARASIPKRPPRPERLYAYYADTEADILIFELNTLSLESRLMESSRLVSVPRAAGCCLVPGGKLLFAGGLVGEMEVDTVVEYDPISGLFTPGAALPRQQAYVFMTTVGEKVYGLGSCSEVNMMGKRGPKETYFEEGGGSGWRLRESTPYPVIYASLSNLGSLIFAIGGLWLFPSGSSTGLICEFNLSTYTWRALDITYPNSNLCWLSLVNTLQNRILCFGGVDLSTGEYSGETWSFDGKGFKPRGKSGYRGKTALGCVEYKGSRVVAVDKEGGWHLFSVETGIWEQERLPLKKDNS